MRLDINQIEFERDRGPVVRDQTTRTMPPTLNFNVKKVNLNHLIVDWYLPLFLIYLFKLFFKGPILLIIPVPISRASASLFRLVILSWVVTRGSWGWWGATFTRGSTLRGWARGKRVVLWLHVKTFLRLGGNGLDWSLNTTILLNDKTLGLLGLSLFLGNHLQGLILLGLISPRWLNFTVNCKLMSQG